mmetsp:Transcript_21270/g.32723  ORF Transcript_21270/g.32723 Transcript_21270/m.32723 type:complete len:312 (+) Transcript_21270:134-1069(+)|eukprot:CAMPEP_0195287498 /NCGR_PEP_ID=MMETSP0707-20130614/4532_1 /TAXON_ID=33640 /ORGANISM="Asterionellopsis glacialis, Strain CCMP134" /LENGTH=311 /DNA_ID=CAMNT_0040347253 /DNA_START=61 /DNA_END=996 /DNA_ORIENTATION=+
MSLSSFSAPRHRLQEMLKAVTETERVACERDLYGQTEVVEETLEFQQDVLERVEEELFKIREEREAFELAQLHCPEYVNGNDFRLMFLRSTHFDVPKAAAKIIYYWSRKVDLFGLDRAFRKLSLQDLEEEDQIGLLNGGIRALPERDEAGRGLLFSYRTLWDNRGGTSHKSMSRVLWYMCHALVEDVEVQRHGIILLAVNLMDSATTQDAKLNRICWRDAQHALPVLLQGSHQLVHNQVMSRLLETTLYAAGSRIQNRFILHKVKCLEMAGELEEYGISATDVPPELGGTLDFDYASWVEERRRIELNDDE